MGEHLAFSVPSLGLEVHKEFQLKKVWGFMIVIFGVQWLFSLPLLLSVDFLLHLLRILPFNERYILMFAIAMFYYIVLSPVITLFILYRFTNRGESDEGDENLVTKYSLPPKITLFSIYNSPGIIAIFYVIRGFIPIRFGSGLTFLIFDIVLLGGAFAFLFSYFFLMRVLDINEIRELLIFGLLLLGLSTFVGTWVFLTPTPIGATSVTVVTGTSSPAPTTNGISQLYSFLSLLFQTIVYVIYSFITFFVVAISYVICGSYQMISASKKLSLMNNINSKFLV